MATIATLLVTLLFVGTIPLYAGTQQYILGTPPEVQTAMQRSRELAWTANICGAAIAGDYLDHTIGKGQRSKACRQVTREAPRVFTLMDQAQAAWETSEREHGAARSPAAREDAQRTLRGLAQLRGEIEKTLTFIHGKNPWESD